MNFAISVCSGCTGVRNEDVSTLVHTSQPVGELGLVEEGEGAPVLPVEVSWFEWSGVLARNDMLEHRAYSVEVAVADVGHPFKITCVCIPCEVCWKRMLSQLGTDILYLRIKALEKFHSLVDCFLGDNGIKCSGVNPNWLLCHIVWHGDVSTLKVAFFCEELKTICVNLVSVDITNSECFYTILGLAVY